MQFRVPQFIDVEDKIFGPLTLKQFLYLLGAGGFAFLFWSFIPFKLIAIILSIPVSGFFIALAFVRINERPFIDLVEHAFDHLIKNKRYTWQSPQPKNIEAELAPIVVESTKEAVIGKTRENRLHSIAFGLDVLDRSSEENSQEDEEK